MTSSGMIRGTFPLDTVARFLQELALEKTDDVTVTPRVVFDRVQQAPDFPAASQCDSFVREKIWPILAQHPDVSRQVPLIANVVNRKGNSKKKINTGSSADTASNYEKPLCNLCGHVVVRMAGDTDPVCSCLLPLEYGDAERFIIGASAPLRLTSFGVWGKVDFVDSPTRLQMIAAIASSRYEGFWQFELGRTVNVEAKMLFQHMKTFYKFGDLIRIALPLPTRMRRAGNVSGSGLLWLRRFFDLKHMSPELLRMLSALLAAPVVERVLKLLQERPALLEQDVRTLCLSMFVHSGPVPFLYGHKTASRYFFRVRRELIVLHGVQRVRAWCPQTNRFELAFILKGSPKHQKKLENSKNSKKRTRESITETPLATAFVPISDDVTNLLREAQQQHDNSVCTSPSAADEELPLFEAADVRPLFGKSTDEDVEQYSISGKSELDAEDLEAAGQEAEDDDISLEAVSRHAVFELSLAQQILIVINTLGNEGVLTTELAAYVGIPGKRLMRLLQSCETQGLIRRVPQRMGKHFVYRYFDTSLPQKAALSSTAKSAPSLGESKCPQTNAVPTEENTPGRDTPTDAQHLLPQIGPALLKEGNSVRSSTLLDLARDRRSGSVKLMTEQFAVRRIQLLEWVPQKEAFVLPDLIKYFASVEKTLNGPDRRTVLRLMDDVRKSEPRIQHTYLPNRNNAAGHQVTVYYWSDAVSENEAIEKVEREIAEKKSEGCKDAIRKNLSIIRSLAKTEENEEEGKPSEFPHQKQAIEKLNQQIEQWAQTPTLARTYETKTVIDVQVDPILARIGLLDFVLQCPSMPAVADAPNLIYSQKLLAHYGFVFPAMIRLKLFHRAILDVAAKAQTAVSGCAAHSTFTTRQILRRMTLEDYLKTIGCGYKHPALEVYLKQNDSHYTTQMGLLPTDLYALLAEPRFALRTTVQQAPLVSCRRLLERLSVLKLVECIAQEHKDPRSQEPQSDGIQAPKSYEWQIATRATMYGFVRNVEDTPPTLGQYDLCNPAGFEEYWKALKHEIDRWISEYRHVYRIPGSHRTQPAKRRRVSDTELPAGAVSTTGRDGFPLPANFQLPGAFAKKNWKGQMVLSLGARAQLESFGEALLAKSSRSFASGAPWRQPISTQRSFPALNSLRSYTDILATTSNNSAAIVPEQPIINPQSPEIREIAYRLHIPADLVIRYLLRYFYASYGPISFTGFDSPLLLHLTRDLRYRCHICGALYAQRPGMKQHYLGAHAQDLPEDTSIYSLESYRSHSWSATERKKTRRRRRRAVVRARSDNAFKVDYALARNRNKLSDGSERDVEIDADNTHEERHGSSADLEQRLIAHQIVSRFTREDDFLFLVAVLAAERLMLSTDFVRGQRFAAPEVLGTTLRPPLQLKVLKQRPRFFEEPLQSAPPVDHPVWPLVRSLVSPNLRFPCDLLRTVFKVMLRFNPRNLRVLSSFRRVTPADLVDYVYKLEIPSSGATLRGGPTAFWNDSFCRTQDIPSTVKLILKRNLMKVALMTPSVSYRSEWFNDVINDIPDVAVKAVWRHWNLRGWVVQPKASIELLRKQGVLKYLDEAGKVIENDTAALSNRRYALSHSARVALFGRCKEAVFLAETSQALRRLVDAAVGGEALYEEPTTGPEVAALLEGYAKGQISLELRWEDAEDFYGAKEREADFTLEKLLLSAANVDELQQDSPAKIPPPAESVDSTELNETVTAAEMPVSKTNAIAEKEQHASIEASQLAGDAEVHTNFGDSGASIANHGLFQSTLDEEDLSEGTVSSEGNSLEALKSLAADRDSDEGDSDEEESDQSVSSIKQRRSSEWKKLRALDDEVDDMPRKTSLNASLESAIYDETEEHRVLSRAIEGGVERHLTELTEEVGVSVSYNVLSSGEPIYIPTKCLDVEEIVPDTFTDSGLSNPTTSTTPFEESLMPDKSNISAKDSEYVLGKDKSTTKVGFMLRQIFESDASNNEIPRRLRLLDLGQLWRKHLNAPTDSDAPEITRGANELIIFTSDHNRIVPCEDAAAGTKETGAEDDSSSQLIPLLRPEKRRKQVSFGPFDPSIDTLTQSTEAIDSCASSSASELPSFLVPEYQQVVPVLLESAPTINPALTNGESSTDPISTNIPLLTNQREADNTSLSHNKLTKLKTCILEAVLETASAPEIDKWQLIARRLARCLMDDAAPEAVSASQLLCAASHILYRTMTHPDSNSGSLLEVFAELQPAKQGIATEHWLLGGDTLDYPAAVSALISIYLRIEKSGELGCAESTLNMELNCIDALATGSNRNISDAKWTSSTLPESDASLSDSPKNKFRLRTYEGTLLERCIWLLEALRFIIRVPYLHEWRFVSQHHAVNYCVRMRDLRFATPTATERLRQYNERLSLPSFIPAGVWQRWGGWNELCVSKLCSLLQSRENGDIKLEKVEGFLNLLGSSELMILTSRTLCQGILLSSEAIRSPPLSWHLIPAATWVMLDGRLNYTVITGLLCRMMVLLRDYPGCTAERITNQVVLLDLCEVDLLLRLLAEEGLVIRTRLPQAPTEPLHFRTIGINCS